MDSLGVGFDGTKDYNLESRRKILVNHDCVGVKHFSIGEHSFAVPHMMAVDGNFESQGTTRFFESLHSLKQSKAEKANIVMKERVFSELDNFVKSAVSESGESDSSSAFSISRSGTSTKRWREDESIEISTQASGQIKVVNGDLDAGFSKDSSSSRENSQAWEISASKSQYEANKFLRDRQQKQELKVRHKEKSETQKSTNANSGSSAKTHAYIAEMEFIMNHKVEKRS